GGPFAVRAIAHWEGEIPVPWVGGSVRLADLAAAFLAVLGSILVWLAGRCRASERAKRRYWAALEGAADGCLALDEKGRVIFVSPRAAQLLGYEPGELLGQPAAAVLSAESAGPN